MDDRPCNIAIPTLHNGVKERQVRHFLIVEAERTLQRSWVMKRLTSLRIGQFHIPHEKLLARVGRCPYQIEDINCQRILESEDIDLI